MGKENDEEPNKTKFQQCEAGLFNYLDSLK